MKSLVIITNLVYFKNTLLFTVCECVCVCVCVCMPVCSSVCLYHRAHVEFRGPKSSAPKSVFSIDHVCPWTQSLALAASTFSTEQFWELLLIDFIASPSFNQKTEFTGKIIFSISQSEQCLSEFFPFHNYCLHVHGCLCFFFVKSIGISQSKHSRCSSSLEYYLLFERSDCFCFIIIFWIFKSEYTILTIIMTFQMLFGFCWFSSHISLPVSLQSFINF